MGELLCASPVSLSLLTLPCAHVCNVQMKGVLLAGVLGTALSSSCSVSIKDLQWAGSNGKFFNGWNTDPVTCSDNLQTNCGQSGMISLPADTLSAAQLIDELSCVPDFGSVPCGAASDFGSGDNIFDFGTSETRTVIWPGGGYWIFASDDGLTWRTVGPPTDQKGENGVAEGGTRTATARYWGIGGAGAVTVYPFVSCNVGTAAPATWMSAVNVAASPGALTKNAGGMSIWNGVAISTQKLYPSTVTQGVSFRCTTGGPGQGYASWVPHIFVGLSNAIYPTPTTGTASDYHEFAVKCDQGNLDVYESGVKKGTFGSWENTDVFEIQVGGSTVEYLRNSVAFYTSSRTPSFPLHVDASILFENTGLRDVTVYSDPANACTPVTWTSVVNVVASLGSMQNTAAGHGWKGAAVSAQEAVATARSRRA